MSKRRKLRDSKVIDWERDSRDEPKNERKVVVGANQPFNPNLGKPLSSEDSRRMAMEAMGLPYNRISR